MHLPSSLALLLATSVSTVFAKCDTCPCSTQPIIEKGDLQVYTYHASPVPLVYQKSTDLSFSPTTFTLISTNDEAVLVDAPISPERGEELADWIQATIPGRKLTRIYVTHGHGDHFFAIPTIQKRFPGARVLATQDVYDHMLQQIEPGFFASFWAALFPDLEAPDISDADLDILDPSTSLSFYLSSGNGHHKEQYELRAVPVGEGDTVNSTVLYVPEVKTVITGDVVYGNCYQYLAENPTAELRSQWLKSIDKVAGLRPQYVIPSHALPTDSYERNHLTETKTYIETFEQLVAESSSWQELETSLKGRFPERQGSFILRYSAQTFFNASF